MDAFKAADVYEVAMQIEENGAKLYRHATGLTDDPKMKDVFDYCPLEWAKGVAFTSRQQTPPHHQAVGRRALGLIKEEWSKSSWRVSGNQWK